MRHALKCLDIHAEAIEPFRPASDGLIAIKNGVTEMKRFIVIMILAALSGLGANAKEAMPAGKLSSEDFIKKMNEGIAVYAKEQPEVIDLGHGTCHILISGKPSEIIYRKSGPEDVEPVFPPRVLPEIAASRQQKFSRPKKWQEAAWVAWRDHEKVLNIGFNCKIEAYEAEIFWKVKDANNREWKCWGVFTLGELYSFDRGKEDWVQAEAMSFSWARFGAVKKGVKIDQYLKTLADLRILSDIKVLKQ